MDSGNSGSLQSSSGDEEYDSRAAADSVSAFMNSGGPSSNPPPPPPFFDPLSNYMQHLQNPISSLLNTTLSWPRPGPTRSDPNPPAHDVNPFVFQAQAGVGMDNSSPSAHAPPTQSQNQPAARNPKKRSRASRRAPTTVLTTDTTNFRAMVQEFTGIPAPPFNSSTFQRSRLDIFGTRSTSAVAAQPPSPQYLRRPFAQKPQTPPLPFLSPSFSSGGGAHDGAMAASSSTTNHLASVSSNLFTIQNPLLTSFLQTNPKFPLIPNPPLMASSSKPHNSFETPLNSHAKVVGLDEQFGLTGHENHVSDQTLTALPNLIPSDQNNHHPLNPDGDKDIINNPRSINGGYNFVTTLNGEKGPENGVVRGGGEGMVESWICSSE